MIRVAISVEGPTEREFTTLVLAPYFAPMNIFLYPKPLDGNVSIERAAGDIKKLLSNHDITTTLYDFHGMKMRKGKSVSELLEALRTSVNSDRFIPYIQLYEFEALLLSSPQILAEELGNASQAILIERFVATAGGAENVNDSYETCPSRRIQGMFEAFDKGLQGSLICKKIGIEVLKQKCPRFAGWIDEIETTCKRLSKP